MTPQPPPQDSQGAVSVASNPNAPVAVEDSRRVLYWLLLLLILLSAWYLRGYKPLEATAFLDETSEIILGRHYLAHPSAPDYNQTLNWHYGWFLWPILAAMADRVGGLTAVRELTAMFGVATVLAVYGYARRLFVPEVGLGSAVVFAFLGPAVFSSRFATYDAAALMFLAMGLWLYVRAWQEEEAATWLFAAVCFFLSFLSKYVVAIYFPFLVLLSCRRGRRPFWFFCFPLSLFCAGYAAAYFDVLKKVVSLIGQENQGFQSLSVSLWQIYFLARLDFWILFAFSLLSLIALPAKTSDLARPERKSIGWVGPVLWFGAAVMFGLQSQSGAAHLRFFKHVAYSMLFLTPLSVEGLRRFLLRFACPIYWRGLAAGVLLLAVLLGWLGDSWNTDRLVFWPDLEPVVAFLDGRLTPENRILVNDLAIRYYVSPPLSLDHIAGPYYFFHEGQTGDAAYASAVRTGFFDYIILNGGLGPETAQLKATILPLVHERYALRMSMPDPRGGQTIQIFERTAPPVSTPPQSGPSIEILSPRNGEVVRTDGAAARVQVKVVGAQPGWSAKVDVLTNRWYPQGKIVFDAGGDRTAMTTIYLGSQCHHIVRARLFDADGKQLASSTHFGIARANPDGTAPNCP